MHIVEDSTVTVKCSTLFLYFNLCLGVKLDSLLFSFTSISFLTHYYYGKDLVINVTENPSEPEQNVFKFYSLYRAYI